MDEGSSSIIDEQTADEMRNASVIGDSLFSCECTQCGYSRCSWRDTEQ